MDSIGQQNTGKDTVHNVTSTATNKMLSAIGKMLMENRATLLPTIYSDFIQYASEVTAAQGISEPPELNVDGY